MVSVTSSSGVYFSGFHGLCVTLLTSLFDSLCCSESEDSEIRICEFIPATVCVLSRVFESISGPDALHTVLNSGFVQAFTSRQILDGCQDFSACVILIVSLSLMVSRQTEVGRRG